MLTYRTGAAGAPSAAKAMGEHLLQQTLAPDMAVMAEYYAQGMSPPTPAGAAAARYADEARDGRLPTGESLDIVIVREVDRLDESARDSRGLPVPRDELAVRALGALVAAGLVERDEAIASLGRLGVGPGGALGARLEAATEAARSGRITAA